VKPRCREEEIMSEATELAQALRPKSHNVDAVLKNITDSDHLGQKEAHLAILRVGEVFAGHVTELYFESPCQQHKSKGPHDLIVQTQDILRIVIEVKRFAPTQTSQALEDKIFSNETMRLVEIEEDPDNKSAGSLDTLISEVVGKDDKPGNKYDQLDPNCPNLVWIVSRNLFFDSPRFIGMAAGEILRIEREKTDCRPQTKYPYLTGLGWLHDIARANTSAVPHCYLIHPWLGLPEFLRKASVTTETLFDKETA